MHIPHAKYLGIGASLLASAGIGTGTYFAIDKSNLINVQLKSEGFNTAVEERDWATILDKYKLATKNHFGTVAEAQKETPTGLKEKCKNALQNKSSNRKGYLVARQWCVKPETITTVLTRGKRKVLEADADKNIDHPEWQEVIRKLNKSTFAPQEFKNAINSKTGEEAITAIKAKCHELTNQNNVTINEDFGDKFENTREWCSIKKPDDK
ncbi:hypothetical protein A6V39_03840 [Candidatus Mycoplasma haematobovis]|uniref:Uncharacterized protein n=1 Tax=Candidatus Mycoplasma haematobovis TaxID=432608 RepID=A0A1A9QE88_9MOLU|nr:hypothetical protein [Candidatus Mycoplasma haematobovis]OAL10019.1 hypothetical protein A6V39_03840 [Candidatus Mycoplasma haematobovis]